MKNVNKQRRNFISLSELGYEPQGNNFRGFAYICQSKWVGIIAIKTERTQIHFLFSSDVLVSVAPLDLKVPLTMTRWYRDDFKMSFIWRINDSASINQVRWRQCNWFRLDRLQRTLEVLNWWLPLLQSEECLIHHKLKSTAQYPSLNIPTNAQWCFAKTLNKGRRSFISIFFFLHTSLLADALFLVFAKTPGKEPLLAGNLHTFRLCCRKTSVWTKTCNVYLRPR